VYWFAIYVAEEGGVYMESFDRIEEALIKALTGLTCKINTRFFLAH